jgi:hypothetical protein
MKCKAYFIGVECCLAAPEGDSTGVLSVPSLVEKFPNSIISAALFYQNLLT